MTSSSSLAGVHLRIARPTNDVSALRHFYSEGLGLSVLFEFRDHEGFDGLMLGLGGHGYHLEFTAKKGHDAGRAPTQDNLLVFYLPDGQVWSRAVDRIVAAGYAPVKPFNPYWASNGRTFEDPDGYRVVLQNAAWNNPTALDR
jgi:catechol 2,3-dioxygenase-like lactoylglutathione lyase family enzyme